MMRKIQFLGLLVGLLALLVAGNAVPAAAQRSANEIAYGDTVDGEINTQQPTTSFTFQGKADEVVVVQLLPVLQAALIGGNIRVEDSRGEELADSSKVIGRGVGDLVGLKLPEDDEYTVTVFVNTNNFQPGQFRLRLLQALEIEVGSSLDDVVQGAPRSAYAFFNVFYYVESRDPVTIGFEQIGGEYRPATLVYRADQGNTLVEAGFAGGSGMLDAAISVTGSRDPILIGVGPFGLGTLGQGDNVQAEFRLRITARR